MRTRGTPGHDVAEQKMLLDARVSIRDRRACVRSPNHPVMRSTSHTRGGTGLQVVGLDVGGPCENAHELERVGQLEDVAARLAARLLGLSLSLGEGCSLFV